MSAVSRRLRRWRRMPLISPRQWRRRLMLLGGSVAVALVAIVFGAAADRASEVRHRPISFAVLCGVLPAAGAGLGRWLAGMLPLLPAPTVVLLGMAAYFSGVVQTPITGTVIVVEVTANQAMTIPLLATSRLALGASRLVLPAILVHAGAVFWARHDSSR